MAQVKRSFDKETIGKIGRGALIAASGAAALYILDAVKVMDFGSTLTPLVGAVVPILVNAIKEWMRGE